MGLPTLGDILGAKKPGRDPREMLAYLPKDVLRMEDLKVDMIMTGTVRNVVDFGAFVDIESNRMACSSPGEQSFC